MERLGQDFRLIDKQKMNMDRYRRQTILEEIGEEGQRKLLSASVLIVGVGGLGSPVALYLTAAGIGRIGLVDADVVSLTNLQRQVLYTEAEIGRPKVECARDRLKALSNRTEIEIYPTFLNPKNAEEIIGSYDIVVDGCDNPATRYLIDDICAASGKPYVYGAIGKFSGQVSVFNFQNGKRYRDLYPDETQAVSRAKTGGGVLGTVPALTGSVQANETIKIIIGCGEVLRNKLFLIDMLTLQNEILDL